MFLDSRKQLYIQKALTYEVKLYLTYFFSIFPSSSENLILTLFTQCLSSVGVGYPSPLNTCPKWPPQFEHTISVLDIPNDLSSCLITAPGIESKYAGHPQPDANLCEAL